MDENVRCGECGHERGADEADFCPRCGSTTLAGEPTARAQPRDRRLKAAGIILIVVGGFYGILALSSAVLAPAVTDEGLTALSAFPGTPLSVQVVNGSAALQNVSVLLHQPDGSPLANATTDAAGRANFTQPGSGAVNVTVVTGEGNWTRSILLVMPEGSTLRVDLQDEPADPAWIGADFLQRVLRIFAGVLAVVSLAVVLAGVQALRRRGYMFVLGVAIVGMLPWLVVFVATFQFGALLNLLATGLALALVVGGRSSFQ